MKKLNYQNFKNFVAFVDNGFFVKKAAIDLKITPQGLTTSINRLIKYSDLELFHFKYQGFQKRRQRISGLTPNGKLFYELAKNCIEYYEQIEDMLDDPNKNQD